MALPAGLKSSPASAEGGEMWRLFQTEERRLQKESSGWRHRHPVGLKGRTKRGFQGGELRNVGLVTPQVHWIVYKLENKSFFGHF